MRAADADPESCGELLAENTGLAATPAPLDQGSGWGPGICCSNLSPEDPHAQPSLRIDCRSRAKARPTQEQWLRDLPLTVLFQVGTRGRSGARSLQLCSFPAHRWSPPCRPRLCLMPFDTASLDPNQCLLSSLALGPNYTLEDAPGFQPGLKVFRAGESGVYCKGLNQPEQGWPRPSGHL